jgi:hypothetical protein
MRRIRPGPFHPSAPGRPGARGGSGVRLAVLLGLGLAPASACLCPPRAEALLSTGYRVPRQTVESYQTFLRADLPAQEYLCFSSGFRRRNGLSAMGYGEVRDQLFAQQPWLKLIARAEIVGERSVGEDEHWIDLKTLGRTVRVKLVREAFYEIFRGSELLDDAYADFDDLVRVAPQGDGSRLTARIPLEAGSEELAGLSEVTLARHWKIDDLYELGEEDEPLPPMPTPVQP